MSANMKRKRPLVMTVISIAEVLLPFLLLGVVSFLVFEGANAAPWPEILKIPGWAKWLTACVVSFGGFALWAFLHDLKNEYLEKAGHGIKALEPVIEKAERTVMADTFETTEISSAGEYASIVHVPWTRIQVRHTGDVPCVMEVVKGNTKKIRFFDKNAYAGWKKKQKELHKVPKKVKIEGQKVPIAYPKEMVPLVLDKAEHIFDDGDIAQVKGIIRIEPKQVLFLQQGDLLESEYLTMVGNLLFRLANKIERTCK